MDLAEFAINGSESRITGLTPFFANYAREPRVPANLGHPPLDVLSAEEFADTMVATVTHTRDALERAKRLSGDCQAGGLYKHCLAEFGRALTVETAVQ